MAPRTNVAHFPKLTRHGHIAREREIFREMTKDGRMTMWHRLVATLSSRNGMEFYMSAYSVMWGLSMALDSSARQYPHIRQLTDALGGSLIGLGWLMAALGAVGIIALWTGKRQYRANCALLSAPTWGVMVYAFAQLEPPIMVGIGTYSFALLAELWVYARVQNSMDKLMLVGGRDHVRGG